MTYFDDINAYAAYLNAPRGAFDAGEQELIDADLAKARAAMERVWLEGIPVEEGTRRFYEAIRRVRRRARKDHDRLG